MDQNLREQVLQHVRAEIISGQSAPGTMYSVPALADDLGVSTTPVREALLELSRNGLIEPVRNRGFRVLEPTLEELSELFEVRELLEVRAAELLARRAPKDLGGLNRLADDVRDAVRADDVRGYLEADRRFHHAFIAAAGNALLTNMAMAARDKMRLYGISSRAGLERQAASVAEHYKLIELAMAGNVRSIKVLLKEHIRTWEPIFAEAIQKSGRKTLRRSS
ncbi:GntR family transcriptional regulator [Rhodopila sp.]|jgi:DNA-binding GntR family transcriptional regulator|uniref:GntR family transcriptional regulator n=1 Tax=Rhodopila sp. TaxID=2480087 RepID=UPI002CFCE2A5|nr:GntR family transcriptional regulator [Rhodopila sp.]HVZ06752.1 GntR family transcriptional regulator [Rhodopila sp.]